jgi:peptidoglycan/xylan/chitin deacetylase (PgdA/CDA1 family)
MRTEAKYVRRRRIAGVSVLCVAAAAVATSVLSGSSSGGSGSRSGARGATLTQHRVASRHLATRPIVHNGPRGTESVPILMYHVILAAPPGAPFPGLYVTPALFADQMHALAAAGYHAVTMDQMWDNWHRGTPLPAGKPIVISFDNGYATQYTSALPVLRLLGWVGVENLQLSGLPPSQGGLSRREVRALVRAGWELDTQGYSHADLITLSPSDLQFQVAVARATLRARYHVAARWFCYPSGHYNATVIAAVKAAGFRGSTTVLRGWASPTEDPYRLPRLEVLAGTAPASLLSEIDAMRASAPPGASYPGA